MPTHLRSVSGAPRSGSTPGRRPVSSRSSEAFFGGGSFAGLAPYPRSLGRVARAYYALFIARLLFNWEYSTTPRPACQAKYHIKFDFAATFSLPALLVRLDKWA